MVALAVGLPVARISYAVRNFPIYVASPSLILSLRLGILEAVPGMSAAMIVPVLWLTRRSVRFTAVIDATAVGVAAAMVILKVGHYLTGTAYC